MDRKTDKRLDERQSCHEYIEKVFPKQQREQQWKEEVGGLRDRVMGIPNAIR